MPYCLGTRADSFSIWGMHEIFCGVRCWNVLAHPRFGPPLRHWQNGRHMTGRAKRAAMSSMACSFAITWTALGNVLPVAAIDTGLLVVAAYLVLRPESIGPDSSDGFVQES